MILRLHRWWNRTPLFRKTFWLTLILTCGVVIAGEAAEALTEMIEGRVELPGSETLHEVLIWMVVVAVAAILGSYLLTRLSTDFLYRLHEVVQKISAGQLAARIAGADLHRADEVGQLARGFNDMADGLTDLLDSQRRLMRDISHELRSPLARLKMALALIEKKAAPGWVETAGEYMNQMETDLDRMEDMIGQLLERERLEALGSSGLNPAEMDLARLVKESVDRLSLIAADEGKRIQVDLPAALPCRADKVLLGRAVDNLIKNALHYTRPGTTISVRLFLRRSEAVLEVLDQGPGVPAEHLRDIFRPFFRVDPSRDRVSGGFGLGLAIVSQALSAHGGRVEALNSEDPAQSGLQITVYLPISK